MKINILLEKISVKIVAIISLLIIVPLFIASVFSTSKLDKDFYTYYVADSWGLNLIILLLFLALVIFLNAKKEKFHWNQRRMLVFFAIFLLSMILFIIMTNYSPKADQLNCWNAALGLVNGDYSWWEPPSYLYGYPFQNGFVAYCSIFAFLFGENGYLAIEFINALFLILTGIYMGKLFRLAWKKERTSYVYSIALAFYFPLTLYVTYVYGIVPGLALSVIAIYQEYRFFETNHIKHLIISAVCMSLAILLKPNYLITLIAIVLVLFVHCLKNKKYIILLMIPVYFLVYYVGNTVVNKAIETRTGVETPQGFPTSSWIALGLQENDRTFGWFSLYPWEVLKEVDHDMTAVKSVTDEEVSNLLNDFKEMPDYAVTFFTKKLLSQWNNPTFDSLGIYQSTKRIHGSMPKFIRNTLLDGYQSNQIMMEMMDISHFIILFGCILYFLLFWKQIRIEQLIFMVIFIGGVLFHTIWEAQTQYALYYFVLLIPYAILGYQEMADQVLAGFATRNQEKKSILTGYEVLGKVIGMVIFLFLIGFLVTKKTGYSEIGAMEKEDYEIYCDYRITSYTEP